MNTEASTEWARNNFNAWAKNLEHLGVRAFPHACYRVMMLTLHAIATLLHNEDEKSNSSVYTPATPQSLGNGINYILQGNRDPFSILDKADVWFFNIVRTLNTLTRELHRHGVKLVR